MDAPDFEEQREDLLQSIERDEEVVRGALRDLTGAAGVKLDVRSRIHAFPLSWALGAFLFGMWLGSRGPAIATPEQRRQS